MNTNDGECRHSCRRILVRANLPARMPMLSTFYALLAPLLLLLPPFAEVRAAEPATTNSTSISVPVLLRKWSNVSLESVTRAAEAGQFDAMISLYFTYSGGKGVATDLKEALRWLTKAAEAGNGLAQCLLGQHFEYPSWEHTPSGNRLPPPDMPEALRWYRRAGEQNWAGGQYNLALCYLAGKGMDQDEELGLEWMRKAADQGHVFSMVDLAGLYAAGIGKPRDEGDRPIAILERAVASNLEGNRSKIAEAYENLILRYEHGIGTERDLLAAVEWQCQAAMTDLGVYSLAEPNLAASPRSGGVSSTGEPGRTIIAVTIPDSNGRSEEFVRMLSLYLKASKGSGSAAAQIGDACLAGFDIPKSPMKAWLWFSVAGHDAADRLAHCESVMSSEELEQAKLKLPEFRKQLNEIGSQARLQAG